MSYILEALRRSQAERERGRVPTLAGAALVAEDRAEPPQRWSWALVAVALAAAAVLIALYAALRVPSGEGAATPGSVLSRQASAPPAALPQVAVTERQAVPGAPVRLPPEPAGRDPGPPADSGARGFGGPPSALPPSAVAIPGVLGGAVVAPLVEAPPPKGLVRVPPSPAALPPGRDPRVGPEPAVPDDAAAQLELELQRQLESDPLVAQDSESVEPEDPGPTPVPADLIAAIDAFKHQVKGGGKDQGNERAPDPKPAAAAPRVSPAPADAGDPTHPRLTRDQQAALPKFLMSVHVFDAEPARRFVLINGLRYGEGAKTREGLTVEEIRVDGAVLAHQGHPFFVHR